MNFRQLLQDLLGTWVLAMVLGAMLGMAYGFYDLILVLLYQPHGMEDTAFLTAYLGVTILAVAGAWAAVFCGLTLVTLSFVWQRHWLFPLSIGIGIFLAYTRFNGIGLQQSVLLLRDASPHNLMVCALFALLIACISLGIWAMHLFLDFRPRTQRVVTRLVTSLPWLLGVWAYGLWNSTVHDGLSMNQFMALLFTTPLIALTLCTIRSTWWALGLNCGIALLVFIGTVFLWRSTGPHTPRSTAMENNNSQKKHVLLVVSDTLRRDALSTYNPTTLPTPHLDAFAADSIRFDRAYSPASWTTPAMVSIMTGILPQAHGIMDQGPLSESVHTLSEHYQEQGYTTGAVGMNPMLRPSMAGLSQGFDQLYWQPKNELRKSYLGSRLLARLFPDKGRFKITANTEELTSIALNFYSDHWDKDTFLWLHYFDPHDDYNPPEEFMPEGEAPPGNYLAATHGIRTGHRAKDAASRDWFRQLYLGEVRYVDHEFGRLIAYLKKIKLYDDMTIVFVSDHGEEFWEHDGYGHGHNLYGESIDVPLFIKPSKLDRPRVIRRPVSTVDIMPTLLGNEARSLLTPRLLTKPIFSSATLYYEPQASVILGEWKLIRWLTAGKEALYNLADDPSETQDQATHHPARVEKLGALLDGYLALGDANTATGNSLKLDAATREELQSLGYLE